MLGDAIGGGAGVNPQGAYGNSWCAYACIRRQALDAAGAPLVALSDPEDPDSLLPVGHPVQQLLARRLDPFDRRELVQWMVTWLLLRGELFLDFDDSDSPAQLIEWRDPLDWHEQVQGSRLIGWVYRHQGETLPRLPQQVVHHKLINPANPWRGQSPLQAAARAHAIETGGDELQRSILRRGGERSMLFEAPSSTTDQQAQMLLSQVRARRHSAYEIARDVLLPNGVKAVDPSFTEDDMRVLEYQGPAADKICAVYGMSKSLLGFEDIDKYATFHGRMRVYWEQQLIPLLQGLETALDRHFVDEALSGSRAYLRFDLRKVRALRDQDSDKFQVAIGAHGAGIPWTVLDERFELGLDVASIPGADQVLVSSTLAPIGMLIDEWENPPEPAPAPPAAPGPVAGAAPAGQDDPEDDEDQGEQKAKAFTPRSAKLTNALILKRQLDPRRQIQRTRLLLGLERELRTSWRKHAGTYQRKAAAAVAGVPADETRIEAALKGALKGYGERAADLCAPIHRRAAAEGVLAITELLEDKITHEDRDLFRKAWTPRGEVVNWIAARRNLIQGMELSLFADLMEHVKTAVLDGAQSADIAMLVRARMQHASVSRAAMIGRTETGSAYNTARFVEMRAQEFEEHMWLTAADELVRGSDSDDPFDHTRCNEEVRKIGETFPCGLTHPMQDGAEAGNVINCRCETVPYVREAR